jgi:hypothetical protein
LVLLQPFLPRGVLLLLPLLHRLCTFNTIEQR